MNQTSVNMNPSPSTQEDSLRLSTALSKPALKYFRRSYYLNEGKGINALKLNLKRIHIKKLVEVDTYDADGSVAKTSKRCLKKKLFKYLTDLYLLDLKTSDWLEEFKHARRLTKISIKPVDDYPAKKIASYFKRMNKHVKSIEFLIEDSSETEPRDILKVYKMIRGFPKLKIYKGQSELSEWKQEFQYLYRRLPKISKLEDFEYFFSERSQNLFKELMKEGKSYPKLTKLSVKLGRGEDLEEDENIINDEPKDLNPPPQINLLFPNLRALEIKAHELDNSLYPTFCSSLAQAFEKLPHLEKLSLKLSHHPTGTDFILQGLLKLPLLTSFSFRIDNMNLSQGNLLNAFIKKQTNLISMHLQVRNSDTKELQENQFLENFLEGLSHRPMLKYLTLNLNFWEARSL